MNGESPLPHIHGLRQAISEGADLLFVFQPNGVVACARATFAFFFMNGESALPRMHELDAGNT